MHTWLNIALFVAGCSSTGQPDGSASPSAPTPEPTTPSEPSESPADTGLDGPRITVPPTATPPEDSDALGVAIVRVSTDVPTTLTLKVVDSCGLRTVQWPELHTDHEVELVGLHIGEVNQLMAVLTDEDGREVKEVMPSLVADSDYDLPRLDVLENTDHVLGDDWLVTAPMSLFDRGWIVAYDAAMHPVYALPRRVEDLRWHDGAWWALHEGRGVRWDAQGHELASFERGFMSHELYPLADGGVLSFEHHRVSEPNYPVDAQRKKTKETELMTQAVLQFDAQGQLVQRVSLADVLDTTHVGFLSLDGKPRDWSHANAVIPYDADTWLVSVRHLDVLVAIGHDGALKWMLGDPTGWPSPWREAFLQPEGELTWFRHAHAPELGPDGTLWLFDNGNHGGSPYQPPPDDHVEVSRAVGYRVDPAAGTVEQAWEVHHDDIFSFAMGDVDPFGPSGDDVLITFSSETTLPPQSRIVVRSREGDHVGLDVRFRNGTRFTYRASVIPGMMGADVLDTRP